MIHRFTLFGTNIVVDVNSGAVHVFDDLSMKLLDPYVEAFGEKGEAGEKKEGGWIDREYAYTAAGPGYTRKQVDEALDEIDSLIENGLLFSRDVYRGYAALWDRKPVVKALCLHICHDCNLRCGYCFAGTGSFGGKRSFMSAEVGKKAIDMLLKRSGKRRNLEVDFFGGEPLMNFEVVKEIVAYARSREEEYNKKFKFTLTTNGILLDEDKKEFINKEMGNVVLSLDGRKEVNDRMRKRVDGRGCYDTILPKFLDLAESRNQDNYYVRGTFTRYNLDFSNDVLHLADLGFKQTSVEPVVAKPGSGYDLREEDLPVIYREYEKLAAEYVNRKKEGNGFNFFHFMVDLSQGPCIAKRLSGCGSGCEYLAVTPEGDVYPCHQFVGKEEYKIGSVMDDSLNEDLMAAFQKSNVYTKEACNGCWCKFYCSGGCAANAVEFNGSIDKPYEIGCKLERKRTECALWIQTQLLSQNA